MVRLERGLCLAVICRWLLLTAGLHITSKHREDVKCQQYELSKSSNQSLYELSKITDVSAITEIMTKQTEKDPLLVFEAVILKFLYGPNVLENEQTTGSDNGHLSKKSPSPIPVHYPSGNLLRAELFQNKAGVHLPMAEFLHRGYCRLNITLDFMQTAVNAFAIFLDGSVQDILNLPAAYVLHSARTISMMKIGRDKLAATWTVVKGKLKTEEVPFQTLELYRPLFKYLNGKEIAKLNLSDTRILTYIGTHADLNRHQVGVVASKYIKINKRWLEPKYLNIMNNLLCGVPMTFMRRVPENTYLQLSHQVFYHIRACDPLQRRFYLAMMTRTQALGKSYSWTARDVSRLGLLLAEVEGPDLSTINPEAISGITAQVMQNMDPHNLKYFTKTQIKYMGQKPLNIMAKKLLHYDEDLQNYDESKATVKIMQPAILVLCLYKHSNL